MPKLVPLGFLLPAVAVAQLFANASAGEAASPTTPHLSAQKAALLAAAALADDLKHAGADIKRYHAQGPRFLANSGIWVVLYIQDSPSPGGGTMVVVDDRTGRTCLQLGVGQPGACLK